jgi:hypothetical protein
MRWTLAASGACTGRKRSQRTAKSCGPGAATLASIRPACAGTATVTKKAAHRGEHEGNRKTIARGKPGRFGCTCSSTPVLFVARGLRAQSAPGFPCALDPRGTTKLQSPGENAPRECERLPLSLFDKLDPESLPRHCERSEAIQLSACGAMDCFVAEPVIGRAFARPVGSSQ